MNVIEINLTIDVPAIRKAIKDSPKLEDRELFKQLAGVERARQELKGAMEKVDELDGDVKALINERAKQIKHLGPNWDSIEGDGFKIGRSKVGSVYLVDTEKVDKQFITVSVRPNTDAIKEYEEKERKLPTGVEKNAERGERITIRVKE